MQCFQRLLGCRVDFSYKDRFSLSLLCQQLGVSKAAAVIRLRHLGYIEDRPYLEFFDPVEVWA